MSELELGHEPLVALAPVLLLLQRIADALEDSPADIAFGGGHNTQEVLHNWPVSGRRRIVTTVRSKGNIITVPATIAPSLLLPTNPGRGGIQFVNWGNNPCYLYLADKGDAANGGVAVIYISALGGSWDGTISKNLWCGPVSIASALGTSVTLAEI